MRCEELIRDLRRLTYLWTPEDVLGRLAEWSKLSCWADAEYDYWCEPLYSDLESDEWNRD